ncbi:DUF7402 domain-containing protein [Streptomyces parvus]|uniref:DUF7402 domain-containing protein n=1 Tax=Streptomyces parvus TaxID=66428 RepID=UPI003712483E
MKLVVSRSILGVTATAALLLSAIAVPTAASAADCTTTVANVVAHQDDDLLFMNPDLLDDIDAGACVVTVFLTAGDDGRDADYWQGRERGSQAAYNTMLGLSPDATWQSGTATFAGKPVAISTSPDAGSITEVYLRLPDGGVFGEGYPAREGQSLSQLWDGSIGQLAAIDTGVTYSRLGLVDTIAAIVDSYAPSTVRVQDSRSGQYDHADHTSGAQFALAALDGFAGNILSYRGYSSQTEAINVTGDALAAKTAAIRSYAAHDHLLCTDSVCPSGDAALWTERQYTAPIAELEVGVPGPAAYDGPNVARNARVLSSSEASGQAATRTIDSVADGYPGDWTAEWATRSEGVGAWLLLSWSSAQTIDRVYLYDRPNDSDRITGGLLTFSDGSTVAVPSLNNDGSATVVTFSARVTSSLQLAVTSVSDTTGNVGLAEIEAYNGDVAPGPGPGTDPDPEPDPEPEPVPVQVGVPGPAAYDGSNVARNAWVSASSQASDQPATQAIDSIIDGYPGDWSAEWSSHYQGAGAWLLLSWSSAQTIDRVYLYDRPNASDQVTGGVLTFSDGSTVPVPELNNDGSATIVTFTARATTSLRFTVSSVSESTRNVGLAEIEAYNGDAEPTPTPVPEPDPEPQPDPEPVPDPEPQPDPAPVQVGVPGPAAYDGPNVARNAWVSASSQASDQAATQAIDGVIDGYPGNWAAEWSTHYERNGAWLLLSWSSPQTIDRVQLHDRPNESDQITGGILTFSDGSTVVVPELNNDGSATIVTFPARVTTSLQFTVTSVSDSSRNVGLAEIETYNG